MREGTFFKLMLFYILMVDIFFFEIFIYLIGKVIRR